MNKILTMIMLILFAVTPSMARGSAAANVTGEWIVYEQGLDLIAARLYKRGGKLYGAISHLYGNYPARCSNCKGSKHNRRILGMRILKGLVWSGGRWRGKVLYPAEDRWYPCSIWRQGSKLMAEVCMGGSCKIRRLKRFK